MCRLAERRRVADFGQSGDFPDQPLAAGEITAQRGAHVVVYAAEHLDEGRGVQDGRRRGIYGIMVRYGVHGHGIGRIFHEDPQVLHYGRPGTGIEIKQGMTFTIEPMVNFGRRHVRLLPDGWTVVTKDHSLSAQWEHTILCTRNGYEVLTLGAADRDRCP